jgi:hypothetical protein
LAQETGATVTRAWRVAPVAEFSESATAMGLTNVAFASPSPPATTPSPEGDLPATEVAGGWFDGVAAGLKPISRSAAGAIHSFWSALPEAPREKRS